MEERDEILIDRYLAGELTEAEQSQFNQRKKDDHLFREEVRQYEIAKEAIRTDEDEEILKRFRTLDATLDRKDDHGPPRGHWWIWLGIAVLIVLGFVGWKMNWLKPPSSDTISKVVTDTLKMDHTPADISDTSKAPVIQEQEEKKTDPSHTPEEKKPPMAENASKGKELFAEYFEPYKDDMMDPATRGESDPTPFDKFRLAYWEGRYNEVPGLFKDIGSAQQANDNYRFQLANALLMNGNTKEAISILQSIVMNNHSKYVTEAYFGLGMGYIQMGELTKAKKEIDTYLKLDNAKRKDAARKVLNSVDG